MFCKNCGTQLNDDAKFCGNCGTPVQAAPQPVVEPAPAVVPQPAMESTPVAAPQPAVESVTVVAPQPAVEPVTAVTPQPVVAPIPTVAPQPVAQPVQVTEPVAPQKVKKEKKAKEGKKSKAWLWITIIAVVVVLAAAAVVAYLLFFSPGAKFKKIMGNAETCMSESNYEEAITLYESALEIKDSEEAEDGMLNAYEKLADKQFKAGSYDEAIATYETILKMDKKNKVAKKGIVSCKYEKANKALSSNDYLGAIDLYDEVIASDDSDLANNAMLKKADCMLGIGNNMLDSGDYVAAESYFYEAMNLGDSSHYEKANVALVDCNILRGYAALEEGDTYSAESYFYNANNIDSNCVDVYLGLAQVNADRGDIYYTNYWIDNGLGVITDADDVAKLEEKKAFYNNNIIITKENTSYIWEDSPYSLYLEEEYFDQNGNTTYYVAFNPYNNKISETYYNEQGNISEEIYYDEYGYMNNRYCYEYDNNGNQISYAGYDSGDNLIYKYTYQYDDKDNIINTTEYNGLGEIVYSQEWNYTDDGKTLWNAYYQYEAGELISAQSYQYAYDDQGNETLYLYVSNDGIQNTYSYESINSYEYSNDKIQKITNTVTEKQYDEIIYSYSQVRINEYDGENLISWRCEAEDGTITDEMYSTYENGLLINETYIDENKDYCSSDYTYDSAGNILTETMFYGNTVTAVIDRIIYYQYYEGTGIMSSYVVEDLTEENYDSYTYYDANGRVIKNGNNEYYYEYEYDEYDNMTLDRYYYIPDGTGYEYVYSYNYDVYGNLLEKYNQTDWTTEEYHSYDYQFSDAVKTGYTSEI
ncbi:MAG: tetratricopeptide repeat protein [Lachnospiraceae bacterium]|nr:tetratricopeptide repeat protein [Lachnospiraceae bacterium]